MCSCESELCSVLDLRLSVKIALFRRKQKTKKRVVKGKGKATRVTRRHWKGKEATTVARRQWKGKGATSVTGNSRREKGTNKCHSPTVEGKRCNKCHWKQWKRKREPTSVTRNPTSKRSSQYHSEASFALQPQ